MSSSQSKMADAYDAKMDAVRRVPTFSRVLGRIRRGPLDTLASDSVYVFHNVYTPLLNVQVKAV